MRLIEFLSNLFATTVISAVLSKTTTKNIQRDYSRDSVRCSESSHSPIWRQIWHNKSKIGRTSDTIAILEQSFRRLQGLLIITNWILLGLREEISFCVSYVLKQQ